MILKLLYLTPGCFDKGGISRYSRCQIEAWRDILGNENVIVYSMLGPDENSFEIPFAVDWYAGGRETFHKINFVAHLTRAIISYRPRIIHSAHVNLSGIAKALTTITRAKTILNTYGLEVWSGFRRDTAWGLKSSDFVISDCRFTADYLENEGLRPKGTVQVVWDSVDLTRFYPGPPKREVLDKYSIPNHSTGVNLLTLGRISFDSGHKGYERLLEVFISIANQVPELRLIYAGRGDMIKYLQEKTETFQLQNRVFFTGMIHEGDLPDVYRAAHIFSLVSDIGIGRGEGIPLTPLEAAACGVPILVGNQDGSREAVIEGINGHILDPFDLTSHGNKIVALTRNRTLRTQMGEAARERIEKEFAYPIFREKHHKLLEKWFS